MTDHPRDFSLPQGSPCPDEQRQQATPQSTALTPVVDMPSKAERLISHHDTIAVLDTARYDQMWRVAIAIAKSSFVPESLRMTGPKNARVPLDPDQITANCFLVVNQAVRWNMDPFALIHCASMVHGKLCWEGKVIAAVLDSIAHIKLTPTYENKGELMRITLSGKDSSGVIRIVEGSVSQWKTTGENSPWRPAEYEKMLFYRGSREWARRWEPAVMLGVYGSDEITPTGDVIDITPAPKPPAAPPPRRVVHAQEQRPPETVSRPVRNTEPPPPHDPRSNPVPVKGKSTKMTQFDWNSVEDLDERQWLKDFKVDLDECRNKMMINAIVDRREKTLERLCEAGKKLSNEIIDHALSEIQR